MKRLMTSMLRMHLTKVVTNATNPWVVVTNSSKCVKNMLGIAPLREDVVTDGNIADDVLKNARERAGYYFKVPKVLQD